MLKNMASKSILEQKLETHLSTNIPKLVYYFMETPDLLLSYTSCAALRETQMYRTKVAAISKLPTKTAAERHELLSVLAKHFEKNTGPKLRGTITKSEPTEETMELYNHIRPLLPEVHEVITRDDVVMGEGEIIYLSRNFRKKQNSYQHFITEMSELALREDRNLSSITLTLISEEDYENDPRLNDMSFVEMLFSKALEGRENVFFNINIL